MATESEEHPKRVTLKDKATFTKWHEQMRFIAMEKGMLAGTSGHGLFTEDGVDEAHYDDLRASEKKDIVSLDETGLHRDWFDRTAHRRQ